MEFNLYMDSKLSFMEAFEAFQHGCHIKCGDSRSQSIHFSNGDDMLILFRQDLNCKEWEIKS